MVVLLYCEIYLKIQFIYNYYITVDILKGLCYFIESTFLS